jgi:hypothetical protein
VNQPDSTYQEMRDVWKDYNDRQGVEHQLIDRKITWLLTTQALLFTAYGVTFDSVVTGELESFRDAVAGTGVTIAVLVLVGVLGLIRSKRRSWKTYKVFFGSSETLEPPRPLSRVPLEWGVETRNTYVTLLPDVFLPLVFIVVWAVRHPLIRARGRSPRTL